MDAIVILSIGKKIICSKLTSILLISSNLFPKSTKEKKLKTLRPTKSMLISSKYVIRRNHFVGRYPLNLHQSLNTHPKRKHSKVLLKKCSKKTHLIKLLILHHIIHHTKDKIVVFLTNKHLKKKALKIEEKIQ